LLDSLDKICLVKLTFYKKGVLWVACKHSRVLTFKAEKGGMS
jgi:hypothetical protein